MVKRITKRLMEEALRPGPRAKSWTAQWLAAFAEVAVLFGIMVLIELVTGDRRIGAFGVHPHPYWLIVLPMAVARGLVAGQTASTCATILFVLGVRQEFPDQSLGELSPRSVFWTAKPTKAFVARGRLLEYPDRELGRIGGRVVAIADCLGDWREEIITSTRGEVRIYSSTVPAATRRGCLMQDRLYRTDVAMQTMGYFYPPQLGGTPLIR